MTILVANDLDSSSDSIDYLEIARAMLEQGFTYKKALEQIKLYHENLYGEKAKDYIAYDIAVKALEE